MTILALLAALLAAAPLPRVAILAERGLPHYQANQAVSAASLERALAAAGILAAPVDASGLPAALADPATRVLVNLYGSSFPEPAAEALRAFLARGGSLVSAGIPLSHPCVPAQIGGTSGWRDAGHRPLEVGLGRPGAPIPEAAARLASVPEPAFPLTGAGEPDAVLAPGAQVHWAIDPASLPAGSTVEPVLAVTDGARTIAPVAAVRMPNGVRHVWAGSGLLVDPRRPRQIAFAARALALGAAWCLERADATARIERALPLPEPLTPGAHRLAAAPLPELGPVDRVATLAVAEVGGLPRGRQQALACLQGLANRAGTWVYLVWDAHDRFWLEQLVAQGRVGTIDEVAPEALARRLAPLASGAVLADAASFQAAVTLAGASDWVLTDDETAAAWGLPVELDLRGRFATRARAERWALEQLGPAAAPATLCHLHHTSAPLPLDYLIAGRIPAFWLSGSLDAGDAESDPLGELAVAEALARRTAVPGAVLGWWGCGDPPAGISEFYGMSWASEHGLVTLGTEFSTNLSLLARLAEPVTFAAPPPAPPLEDKVYVAFSILESGNDPWYWQRHQRTIWGREGWGGVPLSWCLGPTSGALQAPVLRWYRDRLPPNHEMFCAVSGLGYQHAALFGDQVADRPALQAAYWRATDAACGALGLRACHLYLGAWGEGTLPGFDAAVAEAAAGAPGIATWLADLGRPEGLRYADSLRRLPGGQPLIRCLTRWVPWEWSSELGGRADDLEARALAAEIRAQIPAERPAFIIGLVLSWSASPAVVRGALSDLGPDVVPVTASQLGELVRQVPR